MTRTGKSLVLALALCASALIPAVFASGKSGGTLDGDLASVLSAVGFTGQIEQTFQTRLEANLGRPIDRTLADLGRMLWFDTRHPCTRTTRAVGAIRPPTASAIRSRWLSACRTTARWARIVPARGTSSLPLVINTALYPAMMWNGRLIRCLAIRSTTHWVSGFLFLRPTSVSACQRRAAQCDPSPSGAGTHAAHRAD